MTAPKQETMDNWTLKAQLINKYYGEAGLESRPTDKQKRRLNCSWCEKFKELDFFHCLHCGASLK